MSLKGRSFAIADTCFIIDWARFRWRDLIFKLFTTVFVSEDVLREIRSEHTIAWVAGSLSKDELSLYTPSSQEVSEARQLIEESRLRPQLPAIDMPEALCLVTGRRHGYVVLTENRGALLAPNYIPEYREVTVWRALEVIKNLMFKELIPVDCRDLGKPFEGYSQDTLHLFPSKSLNKALKEVFREKCVGK